MYFSTCLAALLVATAIEVNAQTFKVSTNRTPVNTYDVHVQPSQAGTLKGGTPRRSKTHVVYDTPDGTEKTYALRTTYYDSNMEDWVTANGLKANVVQDGDDIWVQNIVNSYPKGSWIKGTITDDRKHLEFANHQPYYSMDDYFFYVDIATMDNEGYINADTESDSFVLNYDEETGAFWSDSVELCLSNEDGGVFSYNVSYDYQPFTDTLVTVSEDAQWQPYSLAYHFLTKWDYPRMVYVAKDGNDFYLRGLFTRMPQGIVKGTLQGDSVVFQSKQYIGLYAGTYFMYVKGATVKGYDDDGYGIYKSKDTFAMHYDATTGKLDGPDGILISYGKTGGYFESFPTQDMSPYYAKSVKPARPTWKGWEPYDTQYNLDGNVEYVVPIEDVDGNYVNPDSLFYRFFVNNEQYIFTKSYYKNFEDSTMVNSIFSDRGKANNRTDNAGGTIIWHVMAMPKWVTPDSIGIQSIYFAEGKVTYSDIHYMNTATGDTTTITLGIKDVAIPVANKEVVCVEYHSLNGSRISLPEKGVCLETIIYNDGSKRTMKLIK